MSGSPALQQAATTQNKALQVSASHSPFSMHRHKVRAHSPFPLFSHSPHPSPACVSPIAYPAVSHRFCKSREQGVHSASPPLFLPALSSTHCCLWMLPVQQRDAVQQGSALATATDAKFPIAIVIDQLPAKAPRQIPSLYISRLHTYL